MSDANGAVGLSAVPGRLPPGQRWIESVLRWNIDHPGIARHNPKIRLDEWRLRVDGEVREQREIGWKELLALRAADSVSDFHCVEGWSVPNCRWFGVRFKTLIEVVKPKPAVHYVSFRCADGYTTSLQVGELLGDDVLLAYRLNGEPLEESLGGPLRLVVPSRYAYKSAMWLERITFLTRDELGYWEKRGYSNTADVWKGDRFAS